MRQQPHHTCTICGSPLGSVLLTITEPDRFEKRCGIPVQGYRREWIECTHCGAASNVLPSASTAGLETLRSAYYEVDFADKYQKVMGLPAEKSDNAGRVHRMHQQLKQWGLDTSKNPTILDIGAGTGVFLSRFLDQATSPWHATGIEPDPHAANHLRSLNKFEVIEDLYRGQSALQEFTLVTLNKVLEHIADPVPLLKQVVQAISANAGMLYVELPDKLTIAQRPPADNILGALHCHLYDPHSLHHLFKICGLETLKIERIVEPSGKITVYGFACRPEMLENI